MNKLFQLNPSLRISLINNEIFIWQTTRFSFKIEGNPKEIVNNLQVLRFPFRKDKLPKNLISLFKQLDDRGCIVSSEVANFSQKDRRVAAWSILQPEALSVLDNLKKSFVLLIGAGGVGSATAQAMCRLGIGMLAICDSDIVNKENLTKSFIYDQKDIGSNKAICLRDKLQNQDTVIHTIDKKIIDITTCLNSLPRYPDIVVWVGDDDERETFLNFSSKVLELGIPITTGGVIEHTIIVGPTLMPKDLSKLNLNSLPTCSSSTKLLSDFNKEAINPGTIISVGIAANIISNEVFSIITKTYKPSLRRRQIILDLLTLDTTFQKFI
jgi:hypothetical protein